MNYSNRTDWRFMTNETMPRDPLTERTPRTLREAFGHYEFGPLRHSISFNLQHVHKGMLSILLVVIGLVAAVLFGVAA